MRSGKRTLAGLAAGALVAGLVPFAVVVSATSANAISSTGTVTPVRYVGTTTAAPNSPSAFVLWDKANTPSFGSGSITIQLTGTNAVSGTGALLIDDSAGATNADDTLSRLTLGDTTDDTVVATGNNANVFGATADDSYIRVRAAGAGSYTGRIFNGTDTVSFSFSTTGTATSMTLTPASQTIPVGGATEATVTLFDSAGNPTQPDFNGVVGLTGTAGMTIGSDGSLSAQELASSTADVELTGFATAGTYSLTAEPTGSLLGVAAQSATITASGTVRDSATGNLTVSVPSNAYNSAASTFPTKTAQTPAGTTALTILVDDDTADITGSRTVRLAVHNQSGVGTINGSTDDTQYFNVAIDATSEEGSLELTLGGGAQAATRALVVTQVNASNTAVAVGGTQVTLTSTQTTPAVQDNGVVPTPGGETVATVGASTTVSVQVDDSFGNPATNYTVTARRTSVNGSSVSTNLTTGQTNSSGTATVTVSPLSTTTNGQYEIYTFIAESNATGATATGTLTLQVNYTTSGEVSTLTVTPQTGTARTNASTTFTTFPAIFTAASGDDTTTNPLNGRVGTVVSGGIATQSATTGAVTVTTDITSSLTTYRVNTTPASAYTVTAPEGVKLFAEAPTATTLYSAGAQTATGSSDDSIYIWATKTGTHTFTVTSGGLTATGAVVVTNAATDAYNIGVTPTVQTVTTGAFTDVTVNVTDMFGNAVETDANYEVTAATSGQVRLSTGGTRVTNITTDENGVATLDLTAGGSAGTGIIGLNNTDTAGAWDPTFSPAPGIAAPVKSATATVTVTAAPVPVPTTITWGEVPAEVSAGSITALVATLTDQDGAVMDNTDVNVVITGDATIGTSGIKTGTFTTNAAGEINVGVVAGESGSFTVTATADTNTGATATTSSVTIDPRPVPAEITVLPAGGGVVPSEVEAGSSVAMVATVKDDDGNPEPLEAVEVSIDGDATFANGNKQYVANTGAAGTLGFTVIAGDSGSFTVTATVVSVPSVTTTTPSIAITPAPVLQTIEIVGGRGQAVERIPSGETCRSIAEGGMELPVGCVVVDGVTTGFAAGSLMTPSFRFPGQTTRTLGNPVPTNADGDFDWFRRTGKKIYVWFENGDIRSNNLVISAR